MGEWPADTSVIIPAHNERTSLPGLLSALVASRMPNGLELIVVCNGCTDDTAAVARSVPEVLVIEINEASKRAALIEGNRVAQYGVRAYIDADVVVSQSDLRRLVEAVGRPGTLAAAPQRQLDRRRTAWLVRCYYDIWEWLPQVRTGLFGRGVIVLSAEGGRRVSTLPPMMSDDLLMSEAFEASERQVVEGAEVVIRLPRTTADLIRRRIRVATGNAEMDQRGLRGGESSTSVSTLIGLVRKHPRLMGKVAVFVAITVVARVRARRAVATGDFSTWLRDESSRRA